MPIPRSVAHDYLFAEHLALVEHFEGLLVEYKSLPPGTAPYVAHQRKLREFRNLLANHRLAMRYWRLGIWSREVNLPLIPAPINASL